MKRIFKVHYSSLTKTAATSRSMQDKPPSSWDIAKPLLEEYYLDGRITDTMKRFENRVRARHETVNSRLNAFGILNQAFRTKGTKRMMNHKSAFEACCVLVQYELDNGSPLFHV